MNIDRKKIAGIIDHTILQPDTTAAMVDQACAEAMANGFFSVCILPHYVRLAADILQGSSVKVCTVIGFPLGGNEPSVKAFETDTAIANGADEVDMVMNIGHAKSGNWDELKEDIRTVVDSAGGQIVKVILETCLLSEHEKVESCKICFEAGADFVKTSTGFSSGGATVEDVRLMRQTVGENMGVKASGGIRDYDTACAMINAGASRIGASAGLTIIGLDTRNDSSDY